jgi:hypothetical protein
VLVDVLHILDRALEDEITDGYVDVKSEGWEPISGAGDVIWPACFGVVAFVDAMLIHREGVGLSRKHKFLIMSVRPQR